MSIFPKRTIAGTPVTIHWNFNTSKLRETHICPLVRIGVKDPNGKITMLFERHVLALPGISPEPPATEERKPLYLNKNLPILLIASYLSGKHSREKLVDILENIQAGKHYYFVYDIPFDAPLGKYSLISEVISEGKTRYSKTASDDFFFVERIGIDKVCFNNGIGSAILKNYSPEPTPVKVIEYENGGYLNASGIRAFELSGMEEKEISFKSSIAFISYNEERELIPLNDNRRIVMRNPQFISLKKEQEDSTYIFNNFSNDAFILEKENQNIWTKANGINCRDDLRTASSSLEYDEMIENNLIYEIDQSGKKLPII